MGTQRPTSVQHKIEGAIWNNDAAPYSHAQRLLGNKEEVVRSPLYHHGESDERPKPQERLAGGLELDECNPPLRPDSKNSSNKWRRNMVLIAKKSVSTTWGKATLRKNRRI